MNPPVENSYATRDVSDDRYVGGLVELNEEGIVCESYWDTNGQSSSDGGTGLTTEGMIDSAVISNMSGFDFTNTWVTISGDYPILAWQQLTASFTLSTDSPAVDETITFDGSSSSGGDGTIQTYEWGLRRRRKHRHDPTSTAPYSHIH